MNSAVKGMHAAIREAQNQLDQQPVYDLELHMLFQDFQDMLAEHDRKTSANTVPDLSVGFQDYEVTVKVG